MCRDEIVLEHSSVLLGAKQVSQSTFVADASEVTVVVTGNLELDANVQDECASLDISNVLYTSFCMTRIYKKGYCVNFSRESCVVNDEATGDVIVTGREKSDLYQLNQVGQLSVCVARTATSLKIWHRRQGNINGKA